MNTKKAKRVWKLRYEISLKEGDMRFVLYDDTGLLIMSDTSRTKLSDFAFDHGADEVLHDYDCVKYGT